MHAFFLVMLQITLQEKTECACTCLHAAVAAWSSPAPQIHMLAYSSCAEPASGGIGGLWDVTFLP